MGEGKRTEIEVASKRCLIVGVHVYGRERHEETPLEELVREMVEEDRRDAEKDELCKREGFRVFDYYE